MTKYTDELMVDMDLHLASIGLDPARYPWGAQAQEAPAKRGDGNATSSRKRGNAITDRQHELLQRLVNEGTKNFALLGEHDQKQLQDLGKLDRQCASDLISVVLALPRKQTQEAKSTARTYTQVAIGEGFYLHRNQVVRARASASTGRLYALVLDPETGQFEYAKGRVFELRESMRLTLDQAAKLGAKWHRCAICGTELTHPDSIERGIGPRCAQKL